MLDKCLYVLNMLSSVNKDVIFIIITTTEGRTDKQGVYRTITFNRSCNVLKVNLSGKTAYVAKRMPKQTNI